MLERVTAAKSLARSAVDEIRAVIFELASDGDIDLRRALREVIEDVVAGTRLQVGLRTYGTQQSLPGATQHALVQIAREALFNVVRHADAGHAWLTLRWAPDAGAAGRRATTAAGTRGWCDAGSRPAGPGGRALRPGRDRRPRPRARRQCDGEPPPRGRGEPEASRSRSPRGAMPAEAAATSARLMLVDDHAIVRRGLRSILELEPDISVVAEAGGRERGPAACSIASSPT